MSKTLRKTTEKLSKKEVKSLKKLKEILSKVRKNKKS